MQSIINVFYLTLVSARPTTWIRITAELFLGFAVAQSSLSSQFSNFILAILIIGPLFSTAAYIVNDITDITLDKKHISRKDRPITQGTLDKNTGLFTAFVLFFSAVLLGNIISQVFMIGVVLLIISQSMYTFEPFRLKERFFWDIAVNGFSGGIRFILGYVVGAGKLAGFPILLFLFAVSLKTLLFIGHRLQNRDLERENNFKSTVAILTISQIKMLLATMLSLAGIFYLGAVIYYHWNYQLLIPIVILILLSIPFVIALVKGYLLTQEKTLFWRIYIYIALFVFSLTFYMLSH